MTVSGHTWLMNWMPFYVKTPELQSTVSPEVHENSVPTLQSFAHKESLVPHRIIIQGAEDFIAITFIEWFGLIAESIQTGIKAALFDGFSFYPRKQAGTMSLSAKSFINPDNRDF